jgi:RNA polymerase sigma-70 factor (ECF subfamily)
MAEHTGELDVVTLDAVTDLALAGIYRGRGTSEPPAVGDADLGAALRRLFDEGRRAWPGVELGIGAFVGHLAERVGGPQPSEGRGPDLYLACACVTRGRGAIESFDRAYLPQMGAYLARLGPTPAFVDDVRQEVRDGLFIGRDGAPPRIAGYQGKGALASWVRVVALRVAMNMRRQPWPAAADDDSELDRPAPDDPEMDCEEERYRGAFDEAIRGAIAALDGEQRRILRRHFADGLTLDALAIELGVHRATVARRLAAARAALRIEARRRLQIALGVRESELSSLARVMRSRLDLRLRSVFRTGGHELGELR